MYKNEVRKKDRWFDESGKGCYNMDYMKSMFNKPRMNRAKRKRKKRRAWHMPPQTPGGVRP